MLSIDILCAWSEDNLTKMARANKVSNKDLSYWMK